MTLLNPTFFEVGKIEITPNFLTFVFGEFQVEPAQPNFCFRVEL